MPADSGFEAALARTERELETASRAAAGVVRELKRARSAATTGQVRDLRKSLDTLATVVAELAEQATSARTSYDVDEVELLTSAAYRKELLAAAAEAGLAMFEEDDRLLSYPSLIRILPGDLALEIDRRRDKRLRPSVVVQTLARAQEAGPRFKPEPFLASLASAYDLVLARQRKEPGAVVKLLDVYGVLTLLPGQARDYSKQEFARDLYLLDQNGLVTTGTGADERQLRWAASTGTRQSGVLTTVARSGQQQRYWGIALVQVRRG
jgi:hypothetical protein